MTPGEDNLQRSVQRSVQNVALSLINFTIITQYDDHQREATAAGRLMIFFRKIVK